MRAGTMCFSVMYLQPYTTVLAHKKYLLKEWHIMEHVLANKCIHTAIYQYTYNNTSIHTYNAYVHTDICAPIWLFTHISMPLDYSHIYVHSYTYIHVYITSYIVHIDTHIHHYYEHDILVYYIQISHRYHIYTTHTCTPSHT